MNFILLNHNSPSESMQIFILLKAAYQVEADLIGVADFVPLKRTIINIRDSRTLFYGCIHEDELIGVCEVDGIEVDKPHIDSLGVHPSWFRSGIGYGLVEYVLGEQSGEYITVNTAEKNTPAIALYEKLGFSISNRFETYDEVNMVTLMKKLY